MKQSINCKGKLVDLDRPRVMGIINVTPDSFHDGGQYNHIDGVLKRTETHLKDGADFIDVGAVSTRPGSDDVGEEEELQRLIPAVEAIHKAWPNALISVDTYRSKVAEEALQVGACIINDISAGSFDEQMFDVIQSHQVPYILMHMQGTPKTMQEAPQYENVVIEVVDFFIKHLQHLQDRGIHDLIVDPGFGFGKSLTHNYALLQHLDQLKVLDVPILAGISRKSMINKVLKTKPEHALNGTTALHMVALDRGARILRVHDTKEARECVALWEALADVSTDV
jgi:dihydropteroate synthase